MAKIKLGPINKNQVWILWGAGLIIILVLFTLLITPRLKEKKAIELEIIKEEENLAAVKELISKKAQYEKEIAAVSEKIKYYEAKLPQEKETPELLEDLARIATDTKIKYQSIRSNPMVSLKSEQIDLPYYSWPITMKLTCGFHELGNYINQLENATRFIKVESLSINAEKEIFKHQVTLNLITYVTGK